MGVPKRPTISVPVDLLALYATIGFVIILVLARVAHMWVTGFFLPDETLYFQAAIDLRRYGAREFFLHPLYLWFRLFAINDVESFILFAAGYMLIWSISEVYFSYKILKVLHVAPRGAAATLVFLPFVLSHSLISAAFLSEAQAISFTTIGVYLVLRWKRSKSEVSLFLASLSLIIAAGSRETYQPFLAGVVLLFLFLAVLKKSRVRETLLFSVPAAAFLLVYNTWVTQILADMASRALYPGVSWLGGYPTPLASRIVDAPRIFFTGLFLGWGPIAFTIGMIGFVILIRRVIESKGSSDLLPLSFASLFLGIFFATSFWASADPYYSTPTAYSTIIRLSHVSTSAFILVAPAFLSKFSRKYLVGFLVISIAGAASLMPFAISASQSSFAQGYVNRFSFDYKSPYLRAREYLLENAHERAVIIGTISGPWYLYLDNIPNTKNTMYLTREEFLRFRPTEAYILVGKILERTETPGDSGNLGSRILGTLYQNRTSFEQMRKYLFSPYTIRAYTVDPSQVFLPFKIHNQTLIFNDGESFFVRAKIAWLEPE